LPSFRRAGPARVTVGQVGETPVLLIKPWTYMNLSGAAVAPLLSEDGWDPAKELLVLSDEAALPLGTFRLRARGSAGGHNGLKSVQAALQSQEYARLRIGVGPPPEGLEDLGDYVLAPFERGEMTELEALMPTMADAVERWLSEGIDAAMRAFNRKQDPPSPDA
jgi:PTH1 family peptidyl-tRNA hydrolase